MSKSITLNIDYRKASTSGTIPVTIDFISNRVIKEYSELQSDLYEVATKWNRINDIRATIAAKFTEGENIEEIEKLSDEMKTLTNDIMSSKYKDFDRRRFDLIKKILSQNGVTEGELLTFDFWDECVEPKSQNDFLSDAVDKDFEKKKRA